jgi:hypothetical protein
MKTLDALIEKFKEVKESLNKNVNMSYGTGNPNMSTNEKASPPDMQMSEVTKAEAGPNPRVMTASKPISTKDVKDSGPAGFAVTPAKGTRMSVNEIKPVNKMEGGFQMGAPAKVGRVHKIPLNKEEEMEMSENGQWKLNKMGGMLQANKSEGTNRESSPNVPHNKGSSKVMDIADEKTSERASPKGKPYADHGEK